MKSEARAHVSRVECPRCGYKNDIVKSFSIGFGIQKVECYGCWRNFTVKIRFDCIIEGGKK